MRIALLSALDSLTDQTHRLRAFVNVAGRPIIYHQIDLAIAFECTSIICLAGPMTDRMLALKTYAGRSGLQFSFVHSVKELSDTLDPEHDVVAIADGTMISISAALPHVGRRAMIAAFPADAGIAAGFERIDARESWAGLMVIPGALVPQLADLPDDIDMISSLLRLALQNGVSTQAHSETLIASKRWCSIRSSPDAVSVSAKMISDRVLPTTFVAPASAVADRVAHAVMLRHDNPVRVARLSLFMATGLACLACVALYLGQGTAGLIAIFFSGFASRFAAFIGQATRPYRSNSSYGFLSKQLFPAVLDILLVAMAVVQLPGHETADGAFAILVAIGLLRTATLIPAPAERPLFRDAMADRTAIIALMVAGTGFGWLLAGLQAFAIVVLVLLWGRHLRGALT